MDTKPKLACRPYAHNPKVPTTHEQALQEYVVRRRCYREYEPIYRAEYARTHKAEKKEYVRTPTRTQPSREHHRKYMKEYNRTHKAERKLYSSRDQQARRLTAWNLK